MTPFLDRFWRGDGGARRALSIAVPLILSSSSYTVMTFVDRRFLASYSLDAFAACSPAGILAFCFLSFFIGTASYLNAFVAQYAGVDRPDRIGASLWQAMYFALGAWVILAPLALLAEPVFHLAGHGDVVEAMEATYFRILILGSGFVVFNTALSSFYSGQGKTWVVMWVRFFAMGLNIPLTYGMVFGRWGFPEMGVAGAAIATVLSTASSTVVFGTLVLSRSNRRDFGTTRQWRFDGELFRRLLKYGAPNGVQFFVDIMGFTVFLFAVGRLGATELSATNAAWTLNMLIFMPMIGFAVAISTMVGQEIGRGRIEIAKRATTNSFVLVFSYMAVVALALVVVPRPLLGLLFSGAQEAEEVVSLARLLLRFVAFYSLFDAVGLVFSSAIKGAGDTWFVMWVMLLLSTTVLIAPSLLMCWVWAAPITVAWLSPTVYIVLVASVFLLRYLGGKWESMRVIEAVGVIGRGDEAVAAT